MDWQVSFRVFRYKQDGLPARYDTFSLKVRRDEYVLDAVERIWAEHDRSLVFRHACHHAACGACGMRVNGRERLACITRIDAVAQDGGTVTLDPLRNFTVLSDLLVYVAPFYAKLEQARFVIVRQAEPLIDLATGLPAPDAVPALRFENCLECGLCVSACPVPGSDPGYLGPAVLAAIQRMIAEPRSRRPGGPSAGPRRRRAGALALPHRFRVHGSVPLGCRAGHPDDGLAPPQPGAADRPVFRPKERLR